MNTSMTSASVDSKGSYIAPKLCKIQYPSCCAEGEALSVKKP